MPDRETPQIYLITPPEIVPTRFLPQLAAVLDGADVACLRLALSSTDEKDLMVAGDLVRDVAHQRDVPVVVERHVQLAIRLGLDGVHLTDGARSVRSARNALGPDSIVGAHCGASRHDGMTAGEAGADYVSFGPVGATHLGDGSTAEHDLFAWWSEMIEVPVVAEGALDTASWAALAPVTDFFGIGPEIWSAEDPLVALRGLTAD